MRSDARPGAATFVAALALMALGGAVGWALPAPRRDTGAPSPVAAAAVAAAAPEAPAARRPEPGLATLRTIAGNNLRIAASLLVGAVTLGVYSLIELSWVGLSFGHLMRSVWESGTPASTLLLLTAPHTVIEFPALALLGAVEFDLAVLAYRKLRYDATGAGRRYWRALAARALVGLALVAVAALVEVYVTGTLFATRA